MIDMKVFVKMRDINHNHLKCKKLQVLLPVQSLNGKH